jgi:hypothetical protein
MRRWHTMLFLGLATGLAWTVSVAMIGTQADTDPVGPHYDAYNRVFTVALVLLLAFALMLRRHSAGRARVGATLTAIAATLFVAGNVLEFWGAYASGGLTDKTAERLGEDAFWGSSVGWFIFLPGELLLVIGFIIVAAGLPTSGWRKAVIGSGGLAASASTALWAVSPAAAAVAGAWFAVSLAVMASVYQSGSERRGSEVVHGQAS